MLTSYAEDNSATPFGSLLFVVFTVRPYQRVSTWPLTQTYLQSILEVFLLCLAGYILASRGVLDKKTQKVLKPSPSLLLLKANILIYGW